jgi:hypothetical protein
MTLWQCLRQFVWSVSIIPIFIQKPQLTPESTYGQNTRILSFSSEDGDTIYHYVGYPNVTYK